MTPMQPMPQIAAAKTLVVLDQAALAAVAALERGGVRRPVGGLDAHDLAAARSRGRASARCPGTARTRGPIRASTSRRRRRPSARRSRPCSAAPGPRRASSAVELDAGACRRAPSASPSPAPGSQAARVERLQDAAEVVGLDQEALGQRDVGPRVMGADGADRRPVALGAPHELDQLLERLRQLDRARLAALVARVVAPGHAGRLSAPDRLRVNGGAPDFPHLCPNVRPDGVPLRRDLVAAEGRGELGGAHAHRIDQRLGELERCARQR